MKGVSVAIDSKTGDVIELSTQDVEDRLRWRTSMPCLVPKYSTLQRVDLDRSRYIRKLDESVTALPHLKRLKLTRCSALEQLPSSLGNLCNLQEVSNATLCHTIMTR